MVHAASGTTETPQPRSTDHTNKGTGESNTGARMGGAQPTWYMQRLVQLKNTNHAAQITLTRAQASQMLGHLEGWEWNNKITRYIF